MKLLKPFLSILLLILFCSANDNEYKLINSIYFPNADYLTTDKLGHAYVIVENQLLQFDKSGDPVANYSERNLGALTFVDAGNPMKILLFYPDFARVIVLDSKLTPQADIKFRQIGINQPLAVCNSGENGYWVYDREDDQLKKIDPSLKVIQQSGNLTQLLGYQVQPGQMIEENGFVYLNNPESGLLVFDRLATFYKTIPFPGIKNFQVMDKDILFTTKNKFARYNNKSFAETEILLPPNISVRSARIEQNQLYLLTSDSLNFYSF
jgi:hypothetical protein